MVLETTRGKLTLHSEEAAVVPKGVSHRSSSQLRSVVLLLRPSVLTERKNGHRTHTVDTDPPLEKVRMARVLTSAPLAFQPAALARVEDYTLMLITAQGMGPPAVAPPYGALWLVVRGSLTVSLPGGDSHSLDASTLTVLPAGTAYRLSAAPGTVAVTLVQSAKTEP